MSDGRCYVRPDSNGTVKDPAWEGGGEVPKLGSHLAEANGTIVKIKEASPRGSLKHELGSI